MKEIYPEQMKIKCDNENKSILTMYNGEKLSQMTFYHIFSGLELIYNKFNTYISPTNRKDIEREYVEINYCKRGVFECTMSKEKTLFLREGEIAANINRIQRIESIFTKGYYEGIELLIDIEELENNIPQMFSKIIDNIKELKSILVNNDMGIILKPIKEIIGKTNLKIYFKEIYGEPVYTFLKDYKIHRALHLLEETDKNINEIAGIVGYDFW